jgi:hypothetical protein
MASMSKAAIVYVSRNGSTRLAAEILSKRLGAEIVELQQEKGGTGFLLSGFRAKTGRHVKPAGDPWSKVKECELLVLAAPIWAGSPNPLMNGFLDSVDLSGKRVYLLTLQADPAHSRSADVLEHYSRRVREAGGSVGGAQAITGASPGRTAKEEDLHAALDGWAVA